MFKYYSEKLQEKEEPRFVLPLPSFASLVRVDFPSKHAFGYSYINDRFEKLKVGDTVFVDGKLEGVLGKVTDITYSFKFDPEKMRRIVSVCDSDIKGTIFFVNDTVLSFNKTALNYKKVLSWYRPILEEEKIVTVNNANDDGLTIKDRLKFGFNEDVIEDGTDLYEGGNVLLIELDGVKGRAVVDYNGLHELEFEYKNDKIYNFSCDCYNSFNCEHKFATLVMLDNILKTINEKYNNEYCKNNYFCVVNKHSFINDILKYKENGNIDFE